MKDAGWYADVERWESDSDSSGSDDDEDAKSIQALIV